ncbi:MFS transporter [Rathayibacter sp. CAU 1779]
MSTPTVTAQRPWRIAFITGMASYMDAAALVSSGTAISVLYAPTLGLTPTTIGLVLACQQLSFGIGALFGGRLGDRFGRRRVLTLALLVFAVGALILAITSAQWMLFPGAVLAGLGIGADLPVALAMANEVAPRRKKGRAVVLSQLLWTLGSATVSLVVSFVGHLGMTGGRILFGGLVALAIIVVLLRLALPESPEWSAARQAADAAPAGTAVQFSDVKQLLRKPIVWTVVALAVYYGAWNVGASVNGKYGGYMWTTLAGGDIEVYSRWTLVALPITFAATIVFMAAVDSRHRRLFTGIGTVLILLGWAPLAFAGASQLAILSVVFLFGIGSSMAGEPLFKVWAQELVPTLLRGTAQGVTIFVARVIAAVLAFVVPPLLAVAPSAVFIGIFAFAIVSALVWLLWIPRLPKAEQLEKPAVVVVDDTASTTV